MGDARRFYQHALSLDKNYKPAQYAIEHLGETTKGKRTLNSSKYSLQVGAFEDKESAEKLLISLKKNLPDIRIRNIEGKFCVLNGKYNTRNEAQEAKKSLISNLPIAEDFYIKPI